ncbi:hypothetical protein EIP86_002519 [Pleurotus ostreatoroseus]|nr:hypothetical protein EIP86_002519 [Pleurotus ostreatoroseus]
MSDGILVIGAGSDTTSSVLSNAFYFLMSNPDAYKRLQEEVDKFYPAGEDSLDPKYYPEMSYMEAVMLVFNLKGNQARIHFFSLHRDPRHFTDPARFWPERWLIAEGLRPCPPALQASFIHSPGAFVPFSHGPANCVGKALAMHEMRTVVCHVVQRLRLAFAPGWDTRQWEREIEDKFVVRHGKLLVVARARG